MNIHGLPRLLPGCNACWTVCDWFFGLMVPTSAIGQIIAQLEADSEAVSLDNIRLHSRVGRGSCHRGPFAE